MTDKPKGAAPITRPLIERRGKKYQESAKLVDKAKNYSLKEAIELAIKTNKGVRVINAQTPDHQYIRDTMIPTFVF